ncbi:MAG: methyltransferase domain-containing protein [Actinomycetota bacterium]|nr:methyltransferase domain-containing protein [Actinomycetota bacterium]
MAFDPVQYKATTRTQWEDAAEAWHGWACLLERWLGEATENMLDAAEVKTGSRVLDVAAGAGGQTLAAARRVGDTGQVVATDISPTILTYAAKQAANAGLWNVETFEVDAEAIDGDGLSGFDAVISRLGLVYLPDQEKALRGMHEVLREGGRTAHIVYSAAHRNGFFSIPISIIRRRAQLPPPLPGQPGPFSLGTAEALAERFTTAGFSDVKVATLPAPLRLPSAPECVRFERESFGALHQMLEGLLEFERDEVWTEIEIALHEFETPDGFVGPCELHVVSATK